MNQAQSTRYLERLMGDDPTMEELVEMWQDRHPRDRQDIDENDYLKKLDFCLPLQSFDFEMWRAKMRAREGKITGILDGMAICAENSLVLPEWLSVKATQFLGYLGY